MVDSTSFPVHNLNYHKKNENCYARLASVHPFFALLGLELEVQVFTWSPDCQRHELVVAQ